MTNLENSNICKYNLTLKGKWRSTEAEMGFGVFVDVHVSLEVVQTSKFFTCKDITEVRILIPTSFVWTLHI